MKETRKDNEYVILVDENDHMIGTAEKIAAHKNPKLHRAFSIFVFNSRGELLIQKRAANKYHCPGLWANTCCGHPRPGESLRKPYTEGCRKKWVLTQSWRSSSPSLIKLSLKMDCQRWNMIMSSWGNGKAHRKGIRKRLLITGGSQRNT